MNVSERETETERWRSRLVVGTGRVGGQEGVERERERGRQRRRDGERNIYREQERVEREK